MIQRRDFRQGDIYHVYNRGNHREMIFRDILDRRLFVSKIDEWSTKYGVTVLAYCLMDNHFHLLLRQDTWQPITRMMLSLLTGYVRSYNCKYGLVGRLFQGSYQASRILKGEQLAWKSRYIHRNPAKFTDFTSFRWSSVRQYLNGTPGICDTAVVMDMFGGSKDSYAMFLKEPPEAYPRHGRDAQPSRNAQPGPVAQPEREKPTPV